MKTEDLREIGSIREEVGGFRKIIAEIARFCKQIAANRAYFCFFCKKLLHFTALSVTITLYSLHARIRAACKRKSSCIEGVFAE